MQNNENVLEFRNFSILKPPQREQNNDSSQESDYLVNRLNINIKKGEFFALVGESGSGKTLSALSILKLLPKALSTQTQGDILFSGASLLDMQDSLIRQIRSQNISMIFQEPMVSLNPLHKIGNQLLEVFKEKSASHINIHNTNKKGYVLNLLTRVGIKNASERFNHYPHQFSGGERQRIMIAMAIILRPSLLIADEPTTALDVTTQTQIMKLLSELQKELNMSILFITHNLSLVKKYAHKVAVMRNGVCIECEDVEILFSQPTQTYTKHLLNASITIVRTEKKLGEHTHPILAVNNLNVTVKESLSFFNRKKRAILSDFNLTLLPNKNLGIIGESGSGKSTAASAIMRLIESQGSVHLNEVEINNLKHKQLLTLRKDFQMIFQDPFSSLNPRMKIETILEEGLRIHFDKMNKVERRLCVEEMITLMDLPIESLERYPHEFSGGQRQRIAIARALILKPKLLILDEPTSSLDKTNEFQILNLLIKLQNEFNLSYILITHDLDIIRNICDEVIVLENGKIAEHGTLEDIFNNPKAKITQELIEFN